MKISRRIYSLNRLVAWSCAFLIVAELLLVFVSWLLAASTQEGVRSLLSSEGVRWLLGNFSILQASPLLIWLLLLLMSFGCLVKSRILQVISRLACRVFTGAGSSSDIINYRDRLALQLTCVFLILYLAIIFLLTAIPHAILLSATGQLFPSAFSRSLIPLFAFALAIVGGIFGLMSGRFRGIADVITSLSYGISRWASLLVFYIFLMQFYLSVQFVFYS